MIDIEWILERKQHSIFRRLTDVVDDPRVIVETLRILWGEARFELSLSSATSRGSTT